MDTFRVVVAAGGTGGHIFPAVAVVEQLQKQTGGHCSALFLGSADRMETSLIPALGYPYVPMPIVGFKGLTSLSTLTLPLKIMRSVSIARAAIRRHRPNAVICTGAYISYPAGIAAVKEGVPLFVLESNINPGKTNARLAPKAAAVVLAFEESVSQYPAELRSKMHVLGNPVRTQIDASMTQSEARRMFGLAEDKPTVLVFGGSLGARTINNAIASALPMLETEPYQVLWQTGAGYEPPPYLPDNVRALPFIDNMGAAYAAADLVVARSGATTIAELGIVGKAAIFVPLSSASTNEQRRNAAAVERAGGALVLDDGRAAADLATTVRQLMLDNDRRTTMAAAMRSMGHPDAAANTAALILSMCGYGTSL